MLARVNRELGVTIVMATHAPEDVAPYATRTIALGEIGDSATREQVEAALLPRWKKWEAAVASTRLEARRPRSLRARAGGDVPL